MTTMPDEARLVTLGVDTHADTHVAAALDELGRELGTIQIPTTVRGFRRLLDWATDLGVIDRIGIEGTGSWGAGLARWLRDRGFVVVEVDRPNRRVRRMQGKSDTIDALAPDGPVANLRRRHARLGEAQLGPGKRHRCGRCRFGRSCGERPRGRARDATSRPPRA